MRRPVVSGRRILLLTVLLVRAFLVYIDKDKLGSIENTRNRSAFPGKAAADDHRVSVQIVLSAGVLWENPLIGRVYTVDKSRQAPLAAMSVSREDKIKIIPAVYVNKLRTMRQEDARSAAPGDGPAQVLAA